MSRIPDLDPDRMTDAQAHVHAAIAAGPRGSVRGPLRVWLESPGLAERAQALGEYCRFNSRLPPRLSELAILVTAVHWQSSYEWYAHAPPALKGGLSAEVIDVLRRGQVPDFPHEDEAAVHAFATELLRTHQVAAATWDRTVAALGMAGVVDLVGILGYYGLISMTINAFQVALPPGVPDPFPPT